MFLHHIFRLLKIVYAAVQVLDRGGKIEVLVEKSDTLRNQVGFTTSHNHI